MILLSSVFVATIATILCPAAKASRTFLAATAHICACSPVTCSSFLMAFSVSTGKVIFILSAPVGRRGLVVSLATPGRVGDGLPRGCGGVFASPAGRGECRERESVSDSLCFSLCRQSFIYRK